MAAKKTTQKSRKSVSKSAFVRDLPGTLSAKDVSAKAKAAGLDISERYVHVIRSNARRSAKKGNGAAAPQASARRSGRPISSKRTFVLGLPSDMPAAEVIKRAQAEGMQLTVNYVYKIRSRGAAGTGSPARASQQAISVPNAVAVRGSSGSEARFASLVLDIGLSRAAALIDQVRSRVKGLSI